MSGSQKTTGFNDFTPVRSPTEPTQSARAVPTRTPPEPPHTETSSDSILDRHRLEVRSVATPEGALIHRVRGDTHPHRRSLRELGGQWNRMLACWEFEGDDPTAAILKLLEHVAASSEGEATIAAEAGDRPHHYGHRQRLRERFLAGGDDSLPDYELLELLLFFSIPRIDTKPLAKQLLSDFNSFGGVFNAELDRFTAYEEMNRQTVVLFRTIRALASRLTKEQISDGPILSNWTQLIDYLRTSMAYRTVEQFRVLFLDRRNVLIADEVQREGSIDHTPVYPREVVKRALALDASAIIMVHNHPSNNPAPSRGDIDMTTLVEKALKAVGVVLHDHVVISRKGHSSFKQMGLL